MGSSSPNGGEDLKKIFETTYKKEIPGSQRPLKK